MRHAEDDGSLWLVETRTGQPAGLSRIGQAVQGLSCSAWPALAPRHLKPPLALQAVGQVDDDGSRWLVGDHTGQLSLLVLSHDGQAVRGLSLERLGLVSPPSTLTYLDNGVIHVGSCSGMPTPMLLTVADPLQMPEQMGVPSLHACWPMTSTSGIGCP